MMQKHHSKSKTQVCLLRKIGNKHWNKNGIQNSASNFFYTLKTKK